MIVPPIDFKFSVIRVIKHKPVLTDVRAYPNQ
jgi:hypothetical protein